MANSSDQVVETMHEAVERRVREALAASALDAVLVVSPENVLYLAGVRLFTQRLIPDRLACVLWPRKGNPTLVVCDIEEEFSREHSRIQQVEVYREHAESPITAVVRAAKSSGLEAGKIAVEMDYLVARYWEELGGSLPNCQLSAADELLNQIRRTKFTEELDILERGVLATDASIAAGFAVARAGVSETQMANVIREGALSRGLEEVHWLFLSSGINAHLVHRLPEEVVLKEGDLLRCDVGTVLGGYYLDLARTAVMAPASERQRDTYQRLWEVHERAIGLLEPGRRARDVFSETVADMRRKGIPCRDPHVGHSIGLSIHERPILSPDDETVIEAGMVFCVEPAFYNGSDLFHVEDMVLVTNDGPRVLSRSTDWSRLPELGI